MKKVVIILVIILSSFYSKATIHIVNVWSGYFQFVNSTWTGSDITIQLGDTVQWLPLDIPMMMHTITSTNIPSGAASFDVIWQAPADTFFQYVPQVTGLYEYMCTPHDTLGMVGSIIVLNSTTAIQEHTTNKVLLKTIDILGRETKGTNQPLFYIYDDGTVEKRIVIE